jgi:hypothetical protein
MDVRLTELVATFKPRVIEDIKGICEEVKARMSREIATGEVKVKETAVPMEYAIEKMREKQEVWEVKAREKQLAEARLQKQVLEQRLSFLTESLADLSAPSFPSPKQISSETEKLQESALFAKKMQEEQRALQRQRAISLARQVANLQDREALDHSRLLSLERKEAEEREMRVKAMQMQAQARAERLSQFKALIHVRKSPPSIRSLSSPKSEVVRNRETKESLKDHLHRYESRLKTEQQRRLRMLEEKKLTESVHSVLFSNSYAAIQQEERDRKQEQARAASEKLIAASKKRRYAELVREMYFPAVDRRKVEEMQELKAASTHKRLTHKSNGINKRRTEGSTDSERQARPSLPRIRKPFKVDPPSAEKPKPTDYLAEQRRTAAKRTAQTLQQLRLEHIDWDADLHDTSLSEAEKVERVKRKAARLEDRVRRNEALLGKAEVSVQGLDAEAGLNDMLVASVKAKLALLQV